ncbi:hypothetical protein ALC56_12257, partial [Trachymyrmex septentrionalis]
SEFLLFLGRQKEEQSAAPQKNIPPSTALGSSLSPFV